MSVYQGIYDIITTYIFGTVELTSTQMLVTELFSLCACFSLIALPFAVVFGIIRIVTFGWRG